jgi:hypothetical protein
MIGNIDFRKLLPYKDDRKKSFELLCYHIAKREYEGKGAFTPVDDSGGGDGVEFYLTQSNKEVIGWQAKFFHGTDRLKDGGRKAQITKSLIKACEMHPNLTEWYLCTPSKFTVEEQLWFDTELIKSLPSGLLKIPLLKRLTSDDITSFLSRPKFSGIYHFFFGALELDINWFKSRFAENFSLVEAKYDEELHTVDKGIYRNINSILLNEQYLLDWDIYVDSVWKKRNLLKSVMDEIGNTWVGSKHSSTLGNAKALIKGVLIVSDSLIEVMQKDIRQLIKARDVLQLSELSFAAVDLLFDDFLYKIDELRDPVSYIDDELVSLIQGIRQLQNALNSSRFNFKYLFKKQLHIIGDANQGKTHLICHYCKTLINVDNPLLFIPAVRFSNVTSIEQAILNLMDVPSNYSFDDFLNALDEYAEASGNSLPIIIEGLNESTIRFKGFSSIWRTHLPAFTSKISSKKNLVLITTCRPEYAEAIWPNGFNEDFKWIYGFSNPEEAIHKYFKKYKLKADLSFSSLEHFRNPIYLKMFCEAKNPKAQNNIEIDVSIGEGNLLEVFELYINELSKTVSQKYALPFGNDIIQTSLLQISSYLWQNNERAIPISEFHKILNAPLSQERTVGEVLIDESVLFIGNYSNDGESVGFTYDLMAGYLIAKQLILQCTENEHSLTCRMREGFLSNVLIPLNIPTALSIYFTPKINRFINSKIVIKRLFSKDQTYLHPLYQDIRKSVALLIPTNFGRHLHQISDNPIVCSFSISTLFDLQGTYITNDDLKLVEKLFANNHTRKNFYRLFPKTLSLTTHPLNSAFLFKLLKNISMADRDITWTTYLTVDSESTLSHIDEFEKILNAEVQISSNIMSKKKHLVARYMLWYLASSNREIRDNATKALYFYGVIDYPMLMQLTLDSLTLNCKLP